jgi:hypothetical protein
VLARTDSVAALQALAAVCAGVRPEERCLILADTRSKREIVQDMSIVLRALGASVVTVEFEPVDLPGDEPPGTAAAAMFEADVIFELTSNFAGSSPARVQACERGARYLTVPALTSATLRPGGPFHTDFLAGGERARRLADVFDAADEFRLTSSLGTDLRGKFAGRAGRPLWGVATEPGTYAAPPDIEVGAAPVEGTANGRVVVDGSVLFLGPGQLTTPIDLRFEHGLLVDCDGPDAWRLNDALDRSNDERMRNLAEVSIGLNPLSRPGGAPLELEGIVGGAHVALGNNIPYGGSVAARSHIDCVLLRADLELDGKRLDPAA